MKSVSLFGIALACSGMLIQGAHATTYDAGYVSFDQTTPTSAAFDIINLTGPNSTGDATFPISTSLALSSLNLVVSFTTGPTETFGSSYFTVAPDGLSFDGMAEDTTTGQPSGFQNAISATLTGVFNTTTVTLFDGTVVPISPNFSATITPSSGRLLSDGDSSLIEASGGGAPPPPPVVPEPESFVLVGTGFAALAGFRRRFASLSRHKAASVGAVLALGTLAAVAPKGVMAASTVKLATWTSPSAGQSGQTFVNLTASGVPSGSITPGAITVTLNTSCSASGATTTKATSVIPVVGTTDRIQFEIPSSLSTGTYYVSVSGSTTGGTSFTSGNCSEVNVTLTQAELASCVPTSSLAVTTGTNVDAFVPLGYWDSSNTGIKRVSLEGSTPAKTFSTTGPVNSCAANSTTGRVVCTENGSGVDLIKGDALTTLNSSATSYASFSGGSCQNCGVGINAASNTAVIAEGNAGAPSGSGVQILDLASNTFAPAFPLTHTVSEDISIDPGRNLILSPGETGYYDLLKIGAGNALTEYQNNTGVSYLDSAAEDCTTGIAMASIEFSDNIYITDLSQAKFTAGSGGSIGSWSAPGQQINLADGGYSAGTCGISSSPGSGHLAVVTGEFGGSAYSALKLPSTSGTGTPNLADYAYVSSMPNTPDGYSFSAGYDPHTITAYTSPNNNKSYAVVVDYATGTPSYLGVIDLACVLAQPRVAGTHNVVGNASACTRYVATP